MSYKTLHGLSGLTAGSIYCIGRNYSEHAREMRSEVPDQPMVFLKPASSILDDGGTVILPPQSKEVHHEVEMVVAIGKGGKNIPEEKALEHVAGYTIGIDVTARDIQQKAKERSHPWTVAKGFDTFAPLGSFMKAAEIPDPQNLELKLEVNGEIRQQGTTADMIFPVATLIAYLSSIFTLSEGDLIFTGTPEGVSAISDGDKIEASLNENLVTLQVTAAKG